MGNQLKFNLNPGCKKAPVAMREQPAPGEGRLHATRASLLGGGLSKWVVTEAQEAHVLLGRGCAADAVEQFAFGVAILDADLGAAERAIVNLLPEAPGDLGDAAAAGVPREALASAA